MILSQKGRITMALRLDINGDTIHGAFIVNGRTRAPQEWPRGTEVVHRNLKVDCEGISLKNDLVPLIEAAWFVKAQAKFRKMSVEDARYYSNKTIKFDLIRAKMVKVRSMTPDEILEAIRSNPELRAQILKDLEDSEEA